MKAQAWTIPAAKFKNKKTQPIPLVPEAMTILKRRYKTRNSPWVFPQADNPERHLTNPTKAWNRIKKAAQFSGVRIHDLRHTNGSWMAGTGANLTSIGRMLGHRTPRTTAVYARMDVTGIRPAANTAAAAMAKAMKGGK